MSLKKIIYLSVDQYNEMVTNGSITVDGVTYTFSEENIYMTPQDQIVIDTTLSNAGQAADAGAVGEALDKVGKLYEHNIAFKLSNSSDTTLSAELFMKITNKSSIAFTTDNLFSYLKTMLFGGVIVSGYVRSGDVFYSAFEIYNSGNIATVEYTVNVIYNNHPDSIVFDTMTIINDGVTTLS